MTYDAIIEAAAQLLAEGGAAALTTNRVAERTGVSVGSLYQYFPNKEAIVAALHERYLTRVRDIICAAMDEGTSIVDMAVRARAGMLGMSARERAVFGELSRMRAAAEVFEHLEAHDKELVRRGRDALVRLEMMSEERAHYFAYVAIHAAEGILNAVARDRDMDPARLATCYVDLLRHGLESAQARG